MGVRITIRFDIYIGAQILGDKRQEHATGRGPDLDPFPEADQEEGEVGHSGGQGPSGKGHPDHEPEHETDELARDFEVG